MPRHLSGCAETHGYADTSVEVLPYTAVAMVGTPMPCATPCVSTECPFTRCSNVRLVPSLPFWEARATVAIYTSSQCTHKNEGRGCIEVWAGPWAEDRGPPASRGPSEWSEAEGVCESGCAWGPETYDLPRSSPIGGVAAGARGEASDDCAERSVGLCRSGVGSAGRGELSERGLGRGTRLSVLAVSMV